MFHIKENHPNKKLALDECKQKLESLKEKIDGLINITVGLNSIESPRAADMVLICTFKNKNDLEIYRDHPEHLKVVDIIKSHCDRSTVVDYIHHQ